MRVVLIIRRVITISFSVCVVPASVCRIRVPCRLWWPSCVRRYWCSTPQDNENDVCLICRNGVIVCFFFKFLLFLLSFQLKKSFVFRVLLVTPPHTGAITRSFWIRTLFYRTVRVIFRDIIIKVFLVVRIGLRV